MERVRCMLSDAHLPNSFWAEVAATTTHTINRSPCTSIELKTPEEKWKGHPPNLTYLKTFGCIAYAHIKQGKLDPRAVKCMFIGYPEGTKGYEVMEFQR